MNHRQHHLETGDGVTAGLFAGMMIRSPSFMGYSVPVMVMSASVEDLEDSVVGCSMLREALAFIEGEDGDRARPGVDEHPADDRPRLVGDKFPEIDDLFGEIFFWPGHVNLFILQGFLLCGNPRPHPGQSGLTRNYRGREGDKNTPEDL